MQCFKNLIVAIFLFCFSSNVFSQETRSFTKESRKHADAVDLYNKEKYVSAQKLFDEIIETQGSVYANPSQVSDAYFYGAVCAVQLYNKDAVDRIDRFLLQFPQSAKADLARFYLAKYYYNQKDIASASEVFKKINRDLLPNSISDEYNFKYGYCLLQEGETENAKSYFVQVFNNVDSKYNSPAKYYYAHILYEEQNFIPALKYFEELKEDKTFAGITPFYIAQIYYLQKRYDELAQLTPTLMDSAPPKRKAEIVRMTGQILYDKEMYTEALPYLQEAIEGNELATDIDLYVLAYCYFKTRNHNNTVSILEQSMTESDSTSQYTMFLLGNSYLELGKKVEARSAFLAASEMDYDANVAEEALFLYAIISYELPNNAYNESIKAFQKYLSLYPDSKHSDKANEVLALLFFSSKNYKSALDLIEKIKVRTNAIKEAHQRICFNRGVEVFNEQKLDEAIDLLGKSVKIDHNDEVTADSYYLIGEAYYRKGNYKEAIKNLQLFSSSIGGLNSRFYPQACYTLGYAYIGTKEYGKAIEPFDRYLSSAGKKGDKKIMADVYNRLGDSYFMQKKYRQAIDKYDQNIKMKGVDADYAAYQKALSYGALGDYENKINTLSGLTTGYPNSIYVASANFEVGNTYLLLDNHESAYKYFDIVTKDYSNSVFNKEAMLKKGVILYTKSRDDEALAELNQVVAQYQGSQEAKDALTTIKNIYIAQNRVDEYFSYVKNIPHAQISSSEKDSITYLAAENRYMEGDCVGAVKGLKNYLESYPLGSFVLYANFYIADCLQKEGKTNDAIPYLENIVKRPKSIFYERSVAALANGYYNVGEYEKAKFYYIILGQNYETKSNLTLASLGEMRSLFRLKDYENAITVAEDVLKLEKVSSEVIDETQYVIARSYYLTNDLEKAKPAYQKLEKSKNIEYSGEANYRKAEFLFQANKINEAEMVISNITSNPTSEYWLAKSFILWAEIYNKRGNTLQAKQTLQSIIDNYDGADLVEEAQTILQEIIAKEEGVKEEKLQKQEEIREQETPVIQINENQE
ncbi:tetratricopeptide repeat protein [Bacteroidales bacterium OttesenSCG-928-C19]|nr:tetratricopeptide repeat protein [Bacteroidales bacterium OttesenSCG-928-C19]